jgi:hypothetical protein
MKTSHWIMKLMALFDLSDHLFGGLLVLFINSTSHWNGTDVQAQAEVN